MLAGALGLAACSGSPATAAGTGGTGSSSSSSSSASGSGGSPAVTTHLVIKNFAFHPADFTVAPGATITVTNRDSVDHTFTARDHAFNTGDIAPGATVTVHAPQKPGTYPYLCLIHQYMTGTLTVSRHP